MPDQMLENIQFKARSGAQVTVDSAQGIVECFVAGIGNKDSVGDIVLPGAFTESLKRRKPRVVWGHSWNDPIGKVLEIYEVPNSDPRLPGKMKNAGIGGLFAKVQFNLGAEKGREAFANVAFFGEEQEWSIGYKTLQATFDPIKQANMLKEVELYEVSPVLHGANQLTGTISVKDGEVGACGVNGCECGTKTMAMEPKAPEGVVFEKGFMMGRMPMVMIPLPMLKPEGDSSDAPNRDIWSRGEATPIDAEERLKLAQEIHGRTNVPIKIIEATENMVVFLRKMTDGTNRMYQMPYEKTDSGQYKFGRPARVRPQTVYTPDNTPKPPSPLGHIHHKPNVGPILGKGPATKGVDSILIPCAIEDVLETKQFLEPLLDYYNVRAVANQEGLILTGGNPDFRDAADTAIKALGRRIGGGLGKGRRAGRALRVFDPDAWDGDNDGLVQEGTPWERPAIPGVNTNLPGMRHTMKKPKGLPKDTRDRDKPSKRPRRSPFLVPPERPLVGEEGRIVMPGERSGELQPFDGSGRLEVRRAQAEAANRMPKDRGGMRSERNARQARLGREFEGVPSEDLEAEISAIERADAPPSKANRKKRQARLRKLYEEVELRDWDDLYNEERRSIPEGPDAAPDPIFNEKLRSKILELIETERQRRADGLTPEPWADRWLGGPDDPRGGMRSRLDRPRSRDQHPSGRPWMFGEKNPVIEERDRLKRGFWENSMERVTTDKLRTNQERRYEGMRSVWDGRRDGGLKPKEDPMTGKEAPPAPVVDQAKVNSLEKQIDDLRTKKMKPLIEQLKQAREKGDAQAVYSVQRKMAELQETESRLRDEVAEAMGKPKSDLIRPGMRSISLGPRAFGPDARKHQSTGELLNDRGNINLLENELHGLNALQERISPRNWDKNDRRLTEKDIEYLASLDSEPGGELDQLLGQMQQQLDDVQASWTKMTEQIDAAYDWLDNHDQEIQNFLEDMDQWGVGRWNVDYEVPPTLWGREQDQMWHKWAVSVFDDHVGPNWSRRGVTYMWNDDDHTYEIYDHDKHFAEFGSQDEAWKEPLVGGMRFNDFLNHYKDGHRQAYGDEGEVRENGIRNLRNWEKLRDDAHEDSEWAVAILERFKAYSRIDSERLDHDGIDNRGTRWAGAGRGRGGMRSAVNRPPDALNLDPGERAIGFNKFPKDHWDAEVIDGQAFHFPFKVYNESDPVRHHGDGGNSPGEVHLDVLGGDHEGLTRVMRLSQRHGELRPDLGPNEMELSSVFIVPSEHVRLNEETMELSFGGNTKWQQSWEAGGRGNGKEISGIRKMEIGFELRDGDEAQVGDRPGDPVYLRDPSRSARDRLRGGASPEARALQAGQRPRPGMRSQHDYMDRGGMRSRHQGASNRFNRNSAVTNLQELDDAAQGIQEFLDANPDFNPDEKKPPSDEAWWDQWTEYDDLRMEFDNLTEIFEGENYEHNASLQQVDSLEESLVQLNRDLDNDVFDLGMAVPADTDLQDIHQLLRNDDRDGFMKLFTPEHIDEFFGDDANWNEGVHNQWARARNVLEDIEEHESERYSANLDLEQTRERGEDGVWGQAQEISDAHYGRLLERNNRIQERSDNPVKPITDEELNEMAEYFGEDARSGGMRSRTSWRDINPDWDIRDPDDQSDWMESEMGPGQTAVGKISTDNVNVEIIPESDVLGDGDGFMVSGYYRDIDGVRGNEAEWFYDLEVFDTPEEAAAWVDSLDEAISNDIPYGDWERPKVDRDSAVPTDPSNENMNDIVGRLKSDTSSVDAARKEFEGVSDEALQEELGQLEIAQMQADGDPNTMHDIIDTFGSLKNMEARLDKLWAESDLRDIEQADAEVRGGMRSQRNNEPSTRQRAHDLRTLWTNARNIDDQDEIARLEAEMQELGIGPPRPRSSGGMRSQRYDIRPDENGKWRVIDTANNNMPLSETYNTRERALRVARDKDRPQGRGGMRYHYSGKMRKSHWVDFLSDFGYKKSGGGAHEGWEWDGISDIPLTIRNKDGNLLPRKEWSKAPQEFFSIPGKDGLLPSPETQGRNFRHHLMGWGLEMTAQDASAFVLGDKPKMKKVLRRLLKAEHPEVENGLDFPDDIPTVREILEQVPGLHRKNRHFGEAEWAKLVADVDAGRDAPEIIMKPRSIEQRFDDEFKRLELQRAFSLTDDQLETVLNADNAADLYADWDSDPDHPLSAMDDGQLIELLAYLDEDPREAGGEIEPPEDLDAPDAPSPPTPPPAPAEVRDPDDVPRSGMRTMSAQNRKQRRDEISEKLDVLNVGLRSALGDRNSDPAEVNRMLNTESRLRVERLELRQADTLASLESGSRSRIRAKKDLEVLLSDDEIGSLRTHLKGKIKATEDPDAKAAFATYDTLLANAKGNKVKVPRATYDNIVNHWEAAVASSSRIHPKTGRDILEFAALNNDGKFTAPGMIRGSGEYSGFRSSRINNGAPPDITPRMQREMLDNWASRQEGRGRVGYQPPGGQEVVPQPFDGSGRPEVRRAQAEAANRMPRDRGGMRSRRGEDHPDWPEIQATNLRRRRGEFDDGIREGRYRGEIHKEPDGSTWEFIPRMTQTGRGRSWVDSPQTGGLWAEIEDREPIGDLDPRRWRDERTTGRIAGFRSQRGAPQPFDGSGRPEVRAAQAAAANRMPRDRGGMRSRRGEDHPDWPEIQATNLRRRRGEFDDGIREGRYRGEIHKEPDGSTWEFIPRMTQTGRGRSWVDSPQTGGLWAEIEDREPIGDLDPRRWRDERTTGRIAGFRSQRGAPQPFDGSGRPEVRAAQAAAANRMRGDHGLMLNAMRDDKHGSPRQWQILRGQHGMRSESGRPGPGGIPTTPGGKLHDGTDVGDGRGVGERRGGGPGAIVESNLPGAKPQGGRPMGTEIEDARSKGKTFAELKPDGWDEMGTQEQWDFLMADLGPESGIRRLDYDRLVKELGKKLDDEERRAARKRGEFPSLEERRARREAQGVGRSRQREETADRVSEPTANRTTKEGAQKERQADLTDLSDRAGRSHHAASLAEQDGDADGSHADLWAQVGDVFDESDDLTFSQLEKVDALLEDYVSGAQPTELSAAETASMANAQKLKGRIENRLEHYRDNQFIQQGEGLTTGSLTASDDVGDSYNMLSSGGMRTIRNNRDSFQTDVLQRYVEARRREGSRGRGRGRIEEAASRGGMRSQGNGKSGRTQVNEKASFFKGVEDSLSVEIREANNKQDKKTAAALKLLQDIMSRQESGKMGEKRTDAGSIVATQVEVDQIMDGLLAVVDRQNAREGSRTEMFAKLLEMFAEAAMSTFVEKSTDEIHARTQRRKNSRGDTVEIPKTS